MRRLIEAKWVKIGILVVAGLVAMMLLSLTVVAQDNTPEPALLCELYSPIVDDVNVRSCASGDCAIIGSLDRIDSVCLVDTLEGWYQIDTDLDDDFSLDGFVSDALLQPGVFTSEPEEFEFCDAYQVIPEEAILRSCPSLDCNIVDTLVIDDVVCALDYDSSYTNWIRIQSNVAESEWVSMDNMAFVSGENTCEEPWSVVSQTAVTRSCPQAFCGAVRTLPQGTEICSLGESDEDLDWIGISYNDDSVAWIFGGLLNAVDLASNEIFSRDEAILATLTAAAPAVAQVATEAVTSTPMPAMTSIPDGNNGCYEYAVTVSSANIRQNPSVDAPVITGVSENTLICVLDVVPFLENEWFIVDINRGEGQQQIGFMAQNTLGAVGQVLPTPTPSPVGNVSVNDANNTVELVSTPSVCTSVTCVEAVAVAAGEPQAIDLTLEQVTRSELSLLSPQSSANFRFTVPADWSILSNNSVTLVFDYVELGTQAEGGRIPASQLDVRFDDELLSSYILDRDNTGVQSVQINLPTAVLADVLDRTHDVELTLTALDHCNADLSSRVTVDKDVSILHLEYVELEPTLNLSLYPRPFFEGHPNQEIVYVVLADDADETALTSAGRIVAGLGAIAGQLDVRTRTVSTLTSAEYSANNLILVGQPETHSLIGALYESAQLPTAWTSEAGFADDAGVAVDVSDGILQIIQHPDDARFAILVVTSESAEGLLKAGQALGGSPVGIGLQGDLSIVQEATPRVSNQDANLLSTGVTLESLGFIEDAVLSGIGEQTVFIEFFVPYGVEVNEQAYIDLLYNYSAVLQDSGATVTIAVNDLPVASNVLRSNPDDTNDFFSTRRLRANIPPNAIQAGVINTITVTLSGYDINECEVINEDALWMTVSRESEIFLPIALEDRQQPLVAQFPAPYNRTPTLSDLLLSMPDDASAQDLDQAMKILFYLGGTGAGASGMNPQIALGTPDESLDLADYHIIALGRPTSNSFFEVIGDDLSQPFADDDSLEQIYSNLLYRVDADYETGLVQVLRSPFNTERDMMVIAGTDDATQAITVTKLLSNFSQFEMAGDIVFVSAQTTTPLIAALLEQEFEIQQSLPDLATESAMLLQQTAQPVAQSADSSTAVPTATVLATQAVATSDSGVQSTAISVVAVEITATPVIEQISADVLTPEPTERPIWVQYLVIGTAVATLVALISRVLVSLRKKED